MLIKALATSAAARLVLPKSKSLPGCCLSFAISSATRSAPFPIRRDMVAKLEFLLIPVLSRHVGSGDKLLQNRMSALQ